MQQNIQHQKPKTRAGLGTDQPELTDYVKVNRMICFLRYVVIYIESNSTTVLHHTFQTYS